MPVLKGDKFKVIRPCAQRKVLVQSQHGSTHSKFGTKFRNVSCWLRAPAALPTGNTSWLHGLLKGLGVVMTEMVCFLGIAFGTSHYDLHFSFSLFS
jgi:hypothetical protein